MKVLVLSVVELQCSASSWDESTVFHIYSLYEPFVEKQQINIVNNSNLFVSGCDLVEMAFYLEKNEKGIQTRKICLH